MTYQKNDIEDVLFLGGPLDGEWRGILRYDRIYRHPVFTPVRHFVGDDIFPLTHTVFEYQRAFLTNRDREYSVFIPTEKDFDLMACLMKGYHPQ
jgi:hypothetical protein